MVTQASCVLPTDDVLTGLGLLLDAGSVRERLRASGVLVEGGSLFYLKYKPRTSCIAAYEFRGAGNGERAFYHGKCFASPQFPLAASKASHHRWTAPGSGAPFLPWPEANALLFAFPNDARLDGLRILAKPRRLRRLVSARLPQLRRAALETELVRYKPERRAVFRSRNGTEPGGAAALAGEFYWRVYGNGEGASVFERMTGLASSRAEHGLRTPLPYDYVPERQLLAMEALPGHPLDACLKTERAVTAVAAAADALARLHRIPGRGLLPRSAEDYLAAAAETTQMLSWLSEEAGDRAGRILAGLRRRVKARPEASAFVHGDFHSGQVMVSDEGVGLLDFDRAHLGSPCADLGAFLAHLRVARLEGRVRDERRLADAFAFAYGERSRLFPDDELRFWTALALLLLALRPFRRLAADWPDEVRMILGSAEECVC